MLSTSVECRSGIPQIPDYDILQKIGQGGMGEVFLARHSESHRPVAVKFVARSSHYDRTASKERFVREARIMSGLAHPNIVAVVDSGEAADRDYFVMEFVSGSSLRQTLTAGPMPLDQARKVIHEVVQALAYLHDKGIVHRDLKPENVLVDEAGNCKVTDFGLSVPLAEVGMVTTSGEFLGTIDYMAPEQRARLPLDVRADQFALGVMTYELLTGKRPLGSFKPASQLNAHVSAAVDNALARAMQEDPDDRFANVLDFEQALLCALATTPARRKRLVIDLAAVACAAAMAAVGLGIWLHKSQVSSASESTLATPTASSAAAAPSLDVTKTPVVPAEPRSAEAAADPNNPEVQRLVEAGNEHAAQRRYPLAEKCYSEAIQLNPENPIPLICRATVYRKRAVYTVALKDMNEAVRLAPQLADARAGRGAVYVQMERFDEAMTDLDEAIRLGAGAEAHAYRGWAKHKLKRADEAASDLKFAVNLDRECGTAHQYRAMQAKSCKQFALARSEYEEAIRCISDNPYSYGGLAQVLVESDDPNVRDSTLALKHATRACELAVWREWSLLNVLGKAHAANGNWAEAIHWTERALEAAPDIQHANLRGHINAYRKRAAQKKESPP